MDETPPLLQKLLGLVDDPEFFDFGEVADELGPLPFPWDAKQCKLAMRDIFGVALGLWEFEQSGDEEALHKLQVRALPAKFAFLESGSSRDRFTFAIMDVAAKSERRDRDFLYFMLGILIGSVH